VYKTVIIVVTGILDSWSHKSEVPLGLTIGQEKKELSFDL
jgi:hypothetical protein